VGIGTYWRTERWKRLRYKIIYHGGNVIIQKQEAV